MIDYDKILNLGKIPDKKAKSFTPPPHKKGNELPPGTKFAPPLQPYTQTSALDMPKIAQITRDTYNKIPQYTRKEISDAVAYIKYIQSPKKLIKKAQQEIPIPLAMPEPIGSKWKQVMNASLPDNAAKRSLVTLITKGMGGMHKEAEAETSDTLPWNAFREFRRYILENEPVKRVSKFSNLFFPDTVPSPAPLGTSSQEQVFGDNQT